MSKTEPFRVPPIKDLAGFRPNEQDKKNLRLLMADRRVTSMSTLLRDLVAQEAAIVRQRWEANAARIAKEEADG